MRQQEERREGELINDKKKMNQSKKDKKKE